MKSMILQINGIAKHYICPSFLHKGEVPDDTVIPTFYTHQHAIKNGWVFTKDIKFSSNNQLVAVCPECAAKEQ